MAVPSSRSGCPVASAIASGLQSPRRPWAQFSWQRALLLTSLLVTLLAISPEPLPIATIQGESIGLPSKAWSASSGLCNEFKC